MLPAILLIPLVALYRIVMAWQTPTGFTATHASGRALDFLASWLPGFCPLSAVALCAGAFLPRRLAFAVPLAILFASDLVIDAHYAAPLFTAAMLGRYVLLALVCAFGLRLRAGGRDAQGGGSPGFGRTLLATVAASTFFYVASITLTWAGSPDYAHNAGGLAQALTVGLPGYLPSWYFYRNALVSDGLYSMVFVACLARTSLRPAGRGAAAQPAVSGTVLWR